MVESILGSRPDGAWKELKSNGTVISRHYRFEGKRRESLASGHGTERSELDGLLFEQHPQPSWVVDGETMAFLAVNEAALRHYRYSRGEFEAMTLKELHPPEQIANLVNEFKRRQPTRLPPGALVTTEWKHRKKDGALIDVEVAWSDIQFEGRPARLGAISDITARKRMEAAARESAERLGTERDRTDRALRASERRFRQLAENIDIVFFIIEIEPGKRLGRFLYVSPAYERIWGRSCESLYRNSGAWLTTLHRHDRRRVLLARPRLARGEFNEQFRITSLDGRTRWIQCRAFPILNEKGEVYRVAGLAEDISERKRAQEQVESKTSELHQAFEEVSVVEEELRSANEELTNVRDLIQAERQRYQDLFESAPDGYVVTDVNGIIQTVNRAATTMLGTHQQTLLGAPFEDFIEPGERDFFRAKLKEMQKTSARHHWEARICPEDRMQFYAALSVVAVHQPWSGQETFRWLMRDISQRKSVEHALRASEARFRHLADSMPQIVWTARPDGRVDYVNKRWHEFTGLPEGERFEQCVKGIIHPEDRPRCRRLWREAVRSGKNYKIEYRLRESQTGEYRWFLGRALAVRDESGPIVRWFGTCTNIDDQKRFERQLQEAQAQLRNYTAELEQRVVERTANLEESIQSLEGVCYHVAHDLRAPLRAMQGFTTLLLQNYACNLDGQGEDFAQRIATASSRMDQLIGDLLDYGRLSHLRLESANVALECQLDAALAQLSSDLTATAAEVRVDRPLPSVWANASVLTQILVNLLSNALKFVKPGVTPRLHIWAERRELAVRLWIQDNGIGIAPEHQERIFHVFERLHASQDYPGTGIGLAIVMKGVQRMGGRAGVESKLGEGSRFWVELPVSQ